MKNKLLFFIFIFTGILMPQNIEFTNHLYNNYENYKETSLTKRRFKHADIVPLIEQLKNNSLFTVKKAGQSAEGRDIYLISTGSGKTKVFLWSQMHGDESTATMALFDLFNFLSSDDLKEEKEKILSNLTIYFMPMVNPDGAEVFERRNIFDIDINRDAVRQQTPEGKILRGTFEELKADFGFNLHDQSTRYSVGNSPKSAVLSFLAPVTNYEKTVNPVRDNAIKLIGVMYTALSEYIPGHIAKYSDDFEPRAFGDNFQKWGTSTILIESGGWENDPEKQFIRKVNFIGILCALKSISDESYKNVGNDIYDSIPFNDNYLKDVVLRNLKVSRNGYEYLIDIGINKYERSIKGASDFYYRSSVDDLGDLSVFYGYEDYDFSGCEITPGKTYPNKFTSLEEVKKLDFKKILSEGYTNVILESEKLSERFVNLPVNIVTSRNRDTDDEIEIGDSPDFIISKDGKIKAAVVNGFVYDLENFNGTKGNGIVY